MLLIFSVVSTIPLILTGCSKVESEQLTLDIDSRPRGATIFVDNEEVGKTPTSISRWYVVRVPTRPFGAGFASEVICGPIPTRSLSEVKSIAVDAYLDGYESQKKYWTPTDGSTPQHMLFILTPIKAAVTVPAPQQQQQQMMGPTIVIGGKTVTGEEAVKIVNYGTVKFDSTPPQAEVLIEGNLVGFTPTAFLKFQAGTYNVEIIKLGYKPWERKNHGHPRQHYHNKPPTRKAISRVTIYSHKPFFGTLPPPAKIISQIQEDFFEEKMPVSDHPILRLSISLHRTFFASRT